MSATTAPTSATTPTPDGAAGSPAEPVLSVRDLSVTFRTETGTVAAVDRVDLQVTRGAVVGVVGESGCGKSVTAMALAGLLPRTARVEGSVRLHDQELVGASGPVLRRVRGKEIAYVFQEPMSSLNPVLTVGAQVVEVLREHEPIGRREARQRAIELLASVGIPSPERRVEQYPHQLSGGMRQRVMIAMAIACEPAVLVADEPTTALDVTVQAGILDLLRALRDRTGTAVLVITHDLGVIADVADEVVVMYAGRVVERAGVDDLFASPQHHYTAGLLEASPRPGAHAGTHRLAEIPGLVPVVTEPPDACTFAGRCPAADETCRTSQPPLSPVPARGSDEGAAHEVACWHPVGETGPGGAR